MIATTILAHLSTSLQLDPKQNLKRSHMADGEMLMTPSEVLPSLHRLGATSEDQVAFLRYPAHDAAHSAQQPISSHSDYGSITVLFSEMLGLQVFLDGKWLYVKPMVGHAVVNCGDALSLFTNGLIPSIVHRVASQAERCSTEARYSLGYFCRPSSNIYLKPLQGRLIPPSENVRDGNEDENYKSRDWVMRRITSRLTERYSGESDWAKTIGTDDKVLN
jgi:isopenicillin N synthase-like dioxygenase